MGRVDPGEEGVEVLTAATPVTDPVSSGLAVAGCGLFRPRWEAPETLTMGVGRGLERRIWVEGREGRSLGGRGAWCAEQGLAGTGRRAWWRLRGNRGGEGERRGDEGTRGWVGSRERERGEAWVGFDSNGALVGCAPYVP